MTFQKSSTGPQASFLVGNFPEPKKLKNSGLVTLIPNHLRRLCNPLCKLFHLDFIDIKCLSLILCTFFWGITYQFLLGWNAITFVCLLQDFYSKSTLNKKNTRKKILFNLWRKSCSTFWSSFLYWKNTKWLKNF